MSEQPPKPRPKPDPPRFFKPAKEKPAPPSFQKSAVPPASPYNRFLASMIIDYEKWHDGIGYDLAALKQLTPEELTTLTQTLIRHSPRDWRDIEALGHIDTPAAKAALIAALKDPDPSIRQYAQTYAPQHIDDKQREKLLIQALEKTDLYGGLSQAIDEAAEFHPPAVIDALFRAALTRDGDGPVHFAALLYYIHGKAAEPFDWNHRPFFLRFKDPDPALRLPAFRELCQTLNVDPAKYL